MFFKVEIDNEGNIGSVEPCESKGRNGRRIIYVEAETKDAACAVAKAWVSRFRETMRNGTRAHRERALVAGKCGCCKRNPRRKLANGRLGKTCQGCQDRAVELAADLRARKRAGTWSPGPPNKLPDSVLFLRQQGRQALNNARAKLDVQLRASGVLRQFDALGPAKFREWLVAKIEAKKAAPAPDSGIAEAAE